MSADPVISRIFTYFDEQHSAKPPGDTCRAGVRWVRRQEKSKQLSVGKTHEYILEYLEKNPSVLAMIDFYSSEDLEARVTLMKNVGEAAGVILSKLNMPLSEDNRYFNQLMALVYEMHFNRLRTVEQASEIEKYGVVSDLIQGMNDILKNEDPHQKYEKLMILLPGLKNLHAVGEEQSEIDLQCAQLASALQKYQHALKLQMIDAAQPIYDFFYDYKFILGLAAVVFVTNLYLFRSEKLTFKTVRAMAGWTVYSSGLAWIGLNLLGMVVNKTIRVMTPIFRYYVPAPKPPLHPLSKSMNEFIEAKLPKCYQAQLPQLIVKWQDTVLARYFLKPESSLAAH